MSNISRRRVIIVRWRRIGAIFPAVALICGGIAFAGQAVPASGVNGVAVSSDSTAIVVPDTALTLGAVPATNALEPFTKGTPTARVLDHSGSVPAGSAPALVLPAGALPGSSAAVALDNNGVPVRALEAYRAAASLVGAADAACHIDWALLASIGRVESNHARFGGNQLDSAGLAQPGIIGIQLDGTNGTARITDTDGGRLDRDTRYDRAVGPMQFIPSTWQVVGADADGDGAKNPQDMTDAATSTAIYLCSGPGDLSRPGDLHGAIMRYNPSESYVRTVTAIADAYRHGVRALPASALPAAHSTLATSDVAKVGLVRPAHVAAPVRTKPIPAKPITPPVAVPPVAPPVTAPPVTAPPVTAPPVTAPPVTAPPVAAPPVTAPPVPSPPVASPPVQCLPVSPPSDPTLTVAPPTDPTVPVIPPADPTLTVAPPTDPTLPTPPSTDCCAGVSPTPTAPPLPTPTLPTPTPTGCCSGIPPTPIDPTMPVPPPTPTGGAPSTPPTQGVCPIVALSPTATATP